MIAVIAIALPVFAVIAAGAIAGRFGFLGGADSQSLNKFVFRFAMPAALFGLTAGTEPPGSADAVIALSYATAAFVVIFSAYFSSKAIFSLSNEEAGAHALSSTLGNAVFLGLPIALAVEGWARPFVVLMLIEGIFVIAFGAVLIARRKAAVSLAAKIGSYFIGPFRNPLVVGMVAGFAYSLIGFPYSGPLETFFSLLGRAAGPTALFALGLFLATHEFPAINKVAGRVGAVAVMKMFVLPVIALSVAYALGLDDPRYLGALALFVFTPSGVASFVIASQYGVYKTETAAAVSFTTLLSVLTISGVLAVFA